MPFFTQPFSFHIVQHHFSFLPEEIKIKTALINNRSSYPYNTRRLVKASLTSLLNIVSSATLCLFVYYLQALIDYNL